jgi:HK97 family phage portal protein
MLSPRHVGTYLHEWRELPADDFTRYPLGMNWFTRLFERRSLEDPKTPLSAPADWLFDALGARKSSTGLAVTPENSLEVTSVWAAVRMISSTLATMPLPVYRHIDGGKERAREHPLYTLLHDRPNPEMSSFVWRELMAAHLLLYGNSFNEIERNGRNDPIALWPIHPASVRVERLKSGERLYHVRVDGQEVPVPPGNMLHIPGFSLDGCTGLVPMALMREAVGVAKATEAFGASFFNNGAAPSGVLSHPGTLGKDGEDNLRESWGKLYSGLSNAHRIAILEEGMTWAPLGVPPEHAQYLETRKFTVSEIARIFLIPPHLIGDLERATFSNVEQQSQDYVSRCIEPWTRRIEQELNYRLFTDRSYFAEFVLEGLLRGDSAARAEFYTKLFNMGAISPNEIRERENMNHVPGGDVRFVPLNMQPLGQERAEDESAV